MSFLGILFIALAKVVDLVAGMYTFLVAGAVIISWVRPDPYNPIVVFLYQATEPVFRFVRRLLPPIFKRGRIDWTPMIVIVMIIFLETIISGTLYDLGSKLRLLH